MNTQTKRRRPEARPEEILDAALSVFSEQGFAAARVEDIARRSGLSKGAVYLYFPSKDAMLNALVEQSAGTLAKAAERVVALGAPGDPETTLRSLVFMLVAAMSDPQMSAAPRLVMTEAQRFPDIAAHYRKHVLEIARRSAQTLVTAGVETGHFRPVDADIMMRVMGGPCIAHMILTTVFDMVPEGDHEPADIADAICDIFIYGLKPRTEPS